jgi:hypothetical protein
MYPPKNTTLHGSTEVVGDALPSSKITIDVRKLNIFSELSLTYFKSWHSTKIIGIP